MPLFVVTDRLHVIDSLPLVWMLDGRIITCEFYVYLLTFGVSDFCRVVCTVEGWYGSGLILTAVLFHFINSCRACTSGTVF